MLLSCTLEHAPGFAYAWLEIVSHRVFIGRILSLTPQQKGWPMYAQLLTALFKFLYPIPIPQERRARQTCPQVR